MILALTDKYYHQIVIFTIIFCRFYSSYSTILILDDTDDAANNDGLWYFALFVFLNERKRNEFLFFSFFKRWLPRNISPIIVHFRSIFLLLLFQIENAYALVYHYEMSF